MAQIRVRSIKLFLVAFCAVTAGCQPRSSQLCSYHKSVTLTPLNNIDSAAQPILNGSVAANGFLLELKFEDTTFPCSNQVAQFWNREPTKAPVNVAFLGVDSISLICNQLFNKARKAGSDVKDCFDMPDLHKLNYDYVRKYYCYLKSPPTDTGSYSFTVLVFTKGHAHDLGARSVPVRLLK